MSRDATLTLVGSSTGKKQTDRDTALPMANLDAAIPVTSRAWVNTEKTIEEILDCIGEEIVSKEVTRKLYRLPIEGDFSPQTAAMLSAYGYGVAAAPTGVTQNTRQTISVTGAPTGGGYKLLLTYDGVAATSASIAPGATLAQMKAIVEDMDNVGAGNTLWTGASPNYTVEFIGKRAAASIPAFTKDVTGFIGGTAPDVAIAVTQVGSQKAHNITRLPGYGQIYTTFGIGWSDVAGSERLIVGAVLSNLRVRGAAGSTGRLTFSADIISRQFVAGTGLVYPTCVVPRPMRTQDCRLVVGAFDITPVLQEFDASIIDNATLTGDSAYTARSVRPSRLERATRRRAGVSFRALGEVTDALYVAAENNPESAVLMATALRMGVEGSNITLNIPNGLVELDTGGGVEFAGDNRETRDRYVVTPTKQGVTLPSNIVASVDQSVAYLLPPP